MCGVNCYLDGPGDQAIFQEVSGLAVLGRTLYVADTLNLVIRAVDLSSAPVYTVSTLAGNPRLDTTQDGTGGDAGFFLPVQPLAYQGTLLVGTGMNIRQITVPGGVVTTFAGPNTGSMASENTSLPVSFSQALFGTVSSLTVDPATGFIYAADQGSGEIDLLNPATQEVSLFAGWQTPGPPIAPPVSAVVLNAGLFLSNSYWNEILLLNLTGPTTVQLVAGSGGTGFSNDNDRPGYVDLFNSPQGLCTDGTSLYIVDQRNKAVRQMNPVTYAVSTVAGGPDAGVFDYPYDCVWDFDAGVLYVSDQSNPANSPDGIGNVIYMVQ